MWEVFGGIVSYVFLGMVWINDCYLSGNFMLVVVNFDM